MPISSRTVRQVPRKGERTRAALLRVAEELFANRGYAATRLEDVAARVGIRRASVFYHFRDKRELYDALLGEMFGALQQRYQAALQTRAPLPERVEAVVQAWVDYVGKRPTVARLLLWEAAAGASEQVGGAARYAAANIAVMSDAIREGQRRGLFQPIDPIHLITAIVGATVFLLAAAPRLVQGLAFNPLSPRQLDAHRREVLEITRRLLGTGTASTRRGITRHRRRRLRVGRSHA
jgi:TetR/AcrR family transcriptional regulator